MNDAFSLVFLLLCILVQETEAQDYLDVPPGFGTLILAIQADTLPNGTRNLNRIYRLENGGFYFLDSTITNDINGRFPLRIQAANMYGMLPTLIPVADEMGKAYLSFNLVADGSLKGLYLSGFDNLGYQIRNNVQLDQDSIKVTIDRCFFDYNWQAPIRMNASEQKLFITNTIIRNCSYMGTRTTGRCIDLRENLVDTLVVQNCTFFIATGEIINDQGGALIRNLLFDHNTIFATDKMESYCIVKGQITNNLFINVGWELDVISYSRQDNLNGDTLRKEILPIDSLRSDLFTEADRNIYISNNNFAFSPGLAAYVDSVDTLDFYVIHNRKSQTLIDNNPNIVSQNWIYEYPDFSNPPGDSSLIEYVISIAEGCECTPSIIADRVPNDPEDILNTYGVTYVLYGLTGNEFKFDYPMHKRSYTHSENEYPLGDLNWFIKTNVAQQDAAHNIPNSYILAQNCPNPFNPTTQIHYSLSQPSRVEVVFYNTMGQRVKHYIYDSQDAGEYILIWHSDNETGQQVSTGIYFCQLKAVSLEGTNRVYTHSIKMMLIK